MDFLEEVYTSEMSLRCYIFIYILTVKYLKNYSLRYDIILLSVEEKLHTVSFSGHEFISMTFYRDSL